MTGYGGAHGAGTIFAFNPPPAGFMELHIGTPAKGSGTFTSNPEGIDCGATCSAAFPPNEVVTITATPGTGYHVSGWTGCATSEGNTCTVTMTGRKQVVPIFALNSYTLAVTGTGSGQGSLSGTGLSCNGSTCSGTYLHGNGVEIIAHPQNGSVVTGWTGCDSSWGDTCHVYMNGNKTVSAGFEPAKNARILRVGKSGKEIGWVRSLPGGIYCGDACTMSFAKGATVTLSAEPLEGFTFAGWSGGGCKGTGTCTVTMTSARSVFASFRRSLVHATASVTGGHGTVRPASRTIPYGATVRFYMVPERNYHIASITVNGYTLPVTNPVVLDYLMEDCHLEVTFAPGK